MTTPAKGREIADKIRKKSKSIRLAKRLREACYYGDTRLKGLLDEAAAALDGLHPERKDEKGPTLNGKCCRTKKKTPERKTEK